MVSQTYHELLVDRYLYQFGETTESSPHTNIVGCMNPGFVTYKCRLNDNFYVNLPYSDPLDIGHKNMEIIGNLIYNYRFETGYLRNYSS